MLSTLVITFLPRSKRLLISWLQSPSAVILEPLKIKSATVFTVSPSLCHEVMGLDSMILVFWMLSFKPTFSLSSFTFVKRLFGSSSFSALKGGVICISEVIAISPSNPDSSLHFFQHHLKGCVPVLVSQTPNLGVILDSSPFLRKSWQLYLQNRSRIRPLWTCSVHSCWVLPP